jgi:imidazolonepropionase-like amidohydrolase
MGLYVAAGLTPAEALRSATATAARSIGVEAERGTLEAGKRADFLVLDGDPLADVANTRRIRQVWKAGRRAAMSLEVVPPTR